MLRLAAQLTEAQARADTESLADSGPTPAVSSDSRDEPNEMRHVPGFGRRRC
jgi:hypothetical protein